MCAIAGVLAWNNENSAGLLKKITSSMSHRGTDAYGEWNTDFISLGHQRLSIQDTSSIANQPMHDASGRYVIVFNGEIYNFK